MDINRNNYETFFLLYLDRELDADGRVEVENFLREHADLQKEFSLLQHTIQRPTDTVFELKELLYHREEKRRFIPVYWMRTAAALLLILAGSFMMRSILNNHKTANFPKEQSVANVDVAKNQKNPDVSAKQNTAKQEVNQTDNATRVLNAQSDTKRNPNTRPAKSNAKPYYANKKGMGDQLKFSAEQQELPGNAEMVIQKSGTIPDLQPGGNRNAEITAGQLPGGANAAPLLIVASGNNHPADRVNEQLTDIQTDNAISVIALNDRNKAITGFFKKLTKRVPVNETAANTKKLRVSVFQFSY